MSEMNPAPKEEGPVELPSGEKDFLAALMQFMRSAKRSQDREVANAARRWESAIEFRIRLAMQAGQRKLGRIRARAKTPTPHPALSPVEVKRVRPTTFRPTSRNQPSVSQSRG